MKIALLGDTAFFGKFSIENNNKIFDYFESIRNRLQEYDEVVLNLETPFNIDSKKNGHKSAYISSEPKNVELLKYLGVTIVNLANNHLFDYGNKSYALTKKILDDNGIKYFGVEGINILLESEGNKISFNGFCCYSTNPLGLSVKGVNILNYNHLKNILEKDKLLGYNTILSIHAGQEHINYPNFDHMKLARKLTDIAPYIYYGHHPHVLQGIEQYNESLLAYSLGNFCFDDIYTNRSITPLITQSENNKSSVILELEFVNNKFINYNIIPIFSNKDRMELGSKKIMTNLLEYSSKLNMDEISYIKMRNSILSKLMHKRKTDRNLKWYFKRLNIRSLFILFDLYQNKKKYYKNLLAHLN